MIDTSLCSSSGGAGLESRKYLAPVLSCFLHNCILTGKSSSSLRTMAAAEIRDHSPLFRPNEVVVVDLLNL